MKKVYNICICVPLERSEKGMKFFMKRKIYNELLKWKETAIDTPLMVIGARQIGKTYIINEFCKNEFENYIYINLLDNPKIVELFEQSISTEEKFTQLQWILNTNIDLNSTIIFFDEIQLSEKLISNLKYFCESDKPYKIICAGSLLGVKINRFHSSFPVGKVRMIYMYPMDFEEFLMATSVNGIIDEIYKCYYNMKPISEPLHEKLLKLYRLYLCIGGMPQAVKNIVEVNQDIFKFDKDIINNMRMFNNLKFKLIKGHNKVYGNVLADGVKYFV